MKPLRVAVFRHHLPVVLALGQHRFAAAGLGVEYTVVRSSGHQRELVESGAADVAHTAADNVAAWHQPRYPWGVARVIDLGLPHQLVARPQVQGLTDLSGRRIAVDSARSGFVTLLRTILASVPLGQPADFVEVGALQLRLEALRAGTADACLLGAEQLQLAIAGGAHSLLALNDYFPRYPGLVVSAVRPHPAIGSYVRVLEGTAARIYRPEAGAEADALAAIATVLGLSPGRAEAWYRAELLRCSGQPGPGGQRELLTAAWQASGRLELTQAAPSGWYRPELVAGGSLG